ncbi:ChaB family protein [Halopseudomonas salina]|uniref:Cation transport regulator n=1 Tax=Halopseudomonas salina TaxID=1323744 RepID=A0ABQ1PFI3_9GAMM|nr:ChaB family protein [Halopseudomonas salina]GGC96127.1 cation transport regulator [Halopseudomonas salina]
MPYDSISELPDSVRNSLPRHAQEIYKEAFDNAWKQYEDPRERKGDDDRETVAHKVAWSAVKQKYEKLGDKWVEKQS